MNIYQRFVVKATLKIIVFVLTKTGSDTSRALWDILTALRGPDNENVRLKGKTTEKIRRLIGLNRRFSRACVSRFATIEEIEKNISETGASVSWHFKSHICEAVLALKGY
jgi:hypothetical protein